MAIKRKMLFLYTELAAYTTACMEHFVSKYSDAEIHLVRWPVNQEAPFEFEFGERIQVYERKNYTRETLTKLVSEINPDAILCSGWIDKDYVRICRQWKEKVPVILAMDNKWFGTWKQQIARVISRFSILRGYNYAWVPGEAQKKYARRLGFPDDTIKTGFYAADAYFFGKQYEAHKTEKQNAFPHRFIFAARYYDFKGVNELWEAFVRLKKETSNDWELWCLGTGDIAPIDHPEIKHFGFVQPTNLPEILKQTGVFILPSRIEPWAVAVHEYAAAGFPLLLSHAVGAKSAFLQENKNGFSFPPNDVDALVTAMRSIISLSDDKLVRMGEISHDVGMRITPDTWADTLYQFLTSKK
jgi:glycosyltransferase involved in cell wall biosynthesis